MKAIVMYVIFSISWCINSVAMNGIFSETDSDEIAESLAIRRELELIIDDDSCEENQAAGDIDKRTPSVKNKNVKSQNNTILSFEDSSDEMAICSDKRKKIANASHSKKGKPRKLSGKKRPKRQRFSDDSDESCQERCEATRPIKQKQNQVKQSKLRKISTQLEEQQSNVENIVLGGIVSGLILFWFLKKNYFEAKHNKKFISKEKSHKLSRDLNIDK